MTTNKNIRIMAKAYTEHKDLLYKRMDAAVKLYKSALRFNEACKTDKKNKNGGQYLKDQYHRDLALFHAALEISLIAKTIKMAYGTDLALAFNKQRLQEMNAAEHFEICRQFIGLISEVNKQIKFA